jgi:hypothetical protein
VQRRAGAVQQHVRQRKWGSHGRSGQRSAAHERGSVWNAWSKAGLLHK